MITSKTHLQVNTERLARQITDAAARSHSEEDLKMAVEPLLKQAMSQVGIDPNVVRYEATSFKYSGRRDSVYGFVTLEYKKPGRLAVAAAAQDAAAQLQRYLDGEAAQHRPHEQEYLAKAVGIAIDGHQVMFVLFSRSGARLHPPVLGVERAVQLFPDEPAAVGFQVLGPYPVTEASVRSMFVYLRASGRRPLDASGLAQVFGPPNEIACQAVAQFYGAAVRAQRQQGSPRVRTFYREWERIFGIVYGESVGKAERAAESTAELYRMPGGVRLQPLLFAIHTYYALLMKLIALELVALQRDSGLSSFVAGLDALDEGPLRDRLLQMESGAEFGDRGITNFLEADFFSWYLDAWEQDVPKAVRAMIHGLAGFEPATPVLEPSWTRDLLQKLYEDVIPHDLRKALGEFYTPDWLAGHLIEQAGYDGRLGVRFLDPACGSGTFLVKAISIAIHSNRMKTEEDAARVGRHILDNISGFDLNPLAVLASRTNFLIAFARFIPMVRPIALPVYLCDSVRAPTRYHREGELELDNPLVFSTTKADYEFPLAMQDREMIDRFTSLVDMAIRRADSKRVCMPDEQFRALLEREFKLGKSDITRLLKVYTTIRKLDEAGENGIWARYIKNAFAPVFLQKCDFVVGNPPWIRWGYLAADYRRATLKMWQDYGLFSLKGHETRLGAGEKDFSMLFTYACADNYLKDGGTLAFLITLEAFKSKGAGEGFRSFLIKNKNVPLRVLWMEDMVHLLPFRAANKTALFALMKGKKTRYPVKMTTWRRKPGTGRIPPDWNVKEVREHTRQTRMAAVPVDPERPVSAWQTVPKGQSKLAAQLKGESAYVARLGARVEPYGVFWLSIKEVRPDGLLYIENMADRGKREIKKTSTSIEPDLVYPAVAGGNLCRFGIRSHVHILMSQDPKTRAPYPSDWMLNNVPLTLGYLSHFKQVLLTRGSRLVREFAEKTEFYAMYGIGPYTVARYRVTWKRMAGRMEAVVLSSVKTEFGTKNLISTDTTSLVPLEDRTEAHYLCALLNSEAVDSYVRSFSSAGRGFGSPSVLANIAIPKFDPNNRLHQRLAELSEEAHQLVKAGKAFDDVQAEIDASAKRLWNIKS